ncbi:efflux transporter outer membrane subunit [Marinicaulis aureus]|uniref:Efflux transporter outer membrane subunit n=1 Tax=Hyphococcus aureus TaxID=2666033 RepID=A0ABW1L2M0_9PROT
MFSGKAIFRSSAAATAILMAASCASVDQELLEAKLPDAPAVWTADADVTVAPTGDWVAAFHDNALRGLIDEALERNNNYLATAANLDQAREGARISRANLLPTLGASARSSRNAIVTDPTSAAQAGGNADASGLRAQEIEDRFGLDSDGDGRLDGLDTDNDGFIDADLPNRRLYINNFSLGAQIQWELDVWGRLTDETRASYKDAAAAYADLEAARLSLAARVAQAWFSLIEARQQRELAERDTQARERNLRVTERRYDRGVSSSLDVRLSRSALGSSQANLALRQRLELESSRALEVLLGRYPSAELEAAATLPSLPQLAGAGAPGEILARRPDLAAAEARMESAGLRARAARKQMLPQLTLSSQISTSGPNLADVLDPERLAGNIAAGLFQPLFQGGRLLANSKRARAAAQASLYSYVQTVLTAYQEAENAIAAETLLAAREEALRLAYEEAAAAEDLTERRYSSGAATIFNLLDAQTRRISSESAYIQAQQQRVSNRVQLYLAIGGDFLTEEKLASLQAETGE